MPSSRKPSPKPSSPKPSPKSAKAPAAAANRPASKPAPSTGTSVRRESVAAIRKTSNNRTQLIIGAVAVVLIAAVVVFALVLNKANDTRRNDGYGSATKATATVAEGVITVSAGTAGKVIDLYEDPICPACGDFEYQFGQEIAQAVNEGKISIRYHLMDFLNSQSSSGNYSTRANAAMICVAQESGSTPGVFTAYHDALFGRGIQPSEDGDSDLSNADLAARATSAGANAAAAACITDGTNVELAATVGKASTASLSAAGGSGTPTVLLGSEKILTDDEWLTRLVAAG